MPDSRHSEIAQRVLFPLEGEAASAALYVRGDVDRLSWTRSTLRLEACACASFDTYFGAFPAAYWLRDTDVSEVTLSIRVPRGDATVTVLAADSGTPRLNVGTYDAQVGRISIDVSLNPTWAWVWFEVRAGADGAVLDELAWNVHEAQLGRATVCITTYDRQDDCVGVLQRLAQDAAVLELIERVFVVDQGDRPLRGTPGLNAAEDALDGRLLVIEQPNLGGSGGFSRGMVETLETDATHVVLLDDDVRLEPESLRRLIAFAARTRADAILGAQMLSLVEPTVLHSYGERVERRGFWWVPVAERLSEVDLTTLSIETSADLRRAYDVDFNGWWMCLFPVPVIRRLGAALPLFIKWDDAEYGLRAAAAGIRTVTLPGAALWHVSWTGKDDGLDWQAYYQLRNRIVAALLHGRRRRGGGVLTASFTQDVNHLLCLQYGSAVARRMALRDVLAGPDALRAGILSRTGEVREAMARAGQAVVADAALPEADEQARPVRPVGRLATVGRAVRVLAHQLTPAVPAGDGRVQRALSRADGKWWSLGMLDSATVASATGRGAFVARRDRRAAAVLLGDALRLRLRLWWRWRNLSRAYRAALPDLVSPSSWAALAHSSLGGNEQHQ